MLESVAASLRADQGLSWACKGLEPVSGRFLHQSAQARLGMKRALAVITGPSFALEVARSLPTAVTVAGTDASYCSTSAPARGERHTSISLARATVGQNALPLMEYPMVCRRNNARAALITRGLAEMMRWRPGATTKPYWSGWWATWC
jgi:glycerol-3-phosphate dehydrogenase (NAD(P)+)